MRIMEITVVKHFEYPRERCVCSCILHSHESGTFPFLCVPYILPSCFKQYFGVVDIWVALADHLEGKSPSYTLKILRALNLVI